jgi:ATP-dependent Lon protease
VKEKVLGARRAGIETILLPERNRKDLMEDVPEEIQKEIRFEFVQDVRQVLELALESRDKEPARAEDSKRGQGIPTPTKKARRAPAPALPDVLPPGPPVH